MPSLKQLVSRRTNLSRALLSRKVNKPVLRVKRRLRAKGFK